MGSTWYRLRTFLYRFMPNRTFQIKIYTMYNAEIACASNYLLLNTSFLITNNEHLTKLSVFPELLV